MQKYLSGEVLSFAEWQLKSTKLQEPEAKTRGANNRSTVGSYTSLKLRAETTKNGHLSRLYNT